MTILARIRAQLEPDPFGGCLLWPGATTGQPRGGYGLIRAGKALVRVHRLVCEAAHGPPPFQGAVVMHACDVRACANEKHLSWGTASENMQAMVSRGRGRRRA
jgi:hypothetical protein